MAQSQRFVVMDGRFAVCRLTPGSPIPATPEGVSFWSLSVTPEEISLVCEEAHAPRGDVVERGWSAIKIVGPLDFSLQGVLLSLLSPLADMHLGVFVMSTYDTDYILVKEFDLAGAVQALVSAGHVQEA
jgi:uncharacterized protein